MAVGLYRKEAPAGERPGALVRYARAEVDVDGPRTVVPELTGAARPDLILVNDDDLTYCKIRFDEKSLDTLRQHLGELTDPLARALSWSALWNLTRDALLPARDYLELVRRFAGAESDIGVLHSGPGMGAVRPAPLLGAGRARGGGRRARRGRAERAAARQPGSGHQLAWARFFAQVAVAESELRMLSGLLDGTARIDGLDVDQELRWTFLAALAASGQADEALIGAELARDDTASGKRHQVRCLAARPSAAVKAEAWDAVVESDRLVHRPGGGHHLRFRPAGPAGSAGAVRTALLRGDRADLAGAVDRDRDGDRARAVPGRPGRRPRPGGGRHLAATAARTRRPRCAGWSWRHATTSPAPCAGSKATRGQPPA